MMVRATDGSETLLKHALPVPHGSRGSADEATGATGGQATAGFNPGPTHHDGSLLSIPGRANELIIFLFSDRPGACHFCHFCHSFGLYPDEPH